MDLYPFTSSAPWNRKKNPFTAPDVEAFRTTLGTSSFRTFETLGLKNVKDASLGFSFNEYDVVMYYYYCVKETKALLT